MAGVNKVILVGRLGADPEMKYTSTGTGVCRFNLATSESWTGKDGQKQERTSYVRCAMWREVTTIAQYITKGTKIYVEGSPDADAYINKEGKAVGNLKINVRELEFLGSAKKAEPGGNSSAEDSLSPAVNDDLPF